MGPFFASHKVIEFKITVKFVTIKLTRYSDLCLTGYIFDEFNRYISKMIFAFFNSCTHTKPPNGGFFIFGAFLRCSVEVGIYFLFWRVLRTSFFIWTRFWAFSKRRCSSSDSGVREGTSTGRPRSSRATNVK